MRQMTFSLPFLPPSLNVYRNDHWRKQRDEEKRWKDCIAVKWAELGRPKLKTVRIGMVFTFPDRRTRDLDNYLATGCKLAGDAVKGLFIPDDSPEHLAAWSFRFEFGDEAGTTMVIEEMEKNADGGFSGEQATLREGNPGEQVLSGRLPGRQKLEAVSVADRPAACTLYETCNAPLCPLHTISLNGIWYPDEEICRSRIHGNLPWMKAQRKLSRVAASGYFTIGMLERLAVIRKGIAGLDPDLPEEAQLRAWFQKRADRQEAQEESQEGRTRHLKKYSFKRRGDGKG